VEAAVMITGLIVAVLLGILSAKVPKLRWVSDFIMAFSMIVGMISAIFWVKIF
jgi:hypothetical protein